MHEYTQRDRELLASWEGDMIRITRQLLAARGSHPTPVQAEKIATTQVDGLRHIVRGMRARGLDEPDPRTLELVLGQLARHSITRALGPLPATTLN